MTDTRSSREVARRIQAGDTLGPTRLRDRLDLSNFQGDRLPDGLHCYELDLRGSALTELPSDLRVDSRLILDGSIRLSRLPPGLTVGSLSLRGCTALTTMPEGFDTWFLDLTDCASFRSWPMRASLQCGALALRGCTALDGLPPWLGRLARLDLADCDQITEIPEGTEVTGWLDLGGSGVRTLPRSLQGVSLRWRGVPVSEQVVFRPEELTARLVVDEKNAEVRRVIIERMGYLRFAQESQAVVLHADRDRGGPRQLLKIDLHEDEPLVGLSCLCPSTGRQYLIRVPPTTSTCHQAAAWIAGFDDPAQYNPVLET